MDRKKTIPQDNKKEVSGESTSEKLTVFQKIQRIQNPPCYVIDPNEFLIDPNNYDFITRKQKK